MNYQETLEYIASTYKLGIKLGLDNITKLLSLLGNPQEKYQIIHVAGTNGKGSVCSFFSSALTIAGYKTGLYTSPYLEVFNERIQINGENISDEKIAKYGTLVKSKVEQMVQEGYAHPSEFEVTTALGFLAFAGENIDVLVLEVGLGGRFDATNVVQKPALTVITSISIDHVEQLGNSLSSIAFEKAGILKEGVPLVLYPQAEEAEKVILQVAKERNVPVIKVNPNASEIIEDSIHGQRVDFKTEKPFQGEIALIGAHQVMNALTAVTGLQYLEAHGFDRLTVEAVIEGLQETRWPGRLELMKTNPLTIIDGAHNEGGAATLAAAMEKYLSGYHVTLVFGMLRDKEIEKVADLVMPYVDRVIVTVPNSDRAMQPEELQSRLEKYGKAITLTSSIAEAVSLANEITGEEEAVVYAGSLYMIGEVRTLLKNQIS